jgi:hypothetical protein
VKSVRPLLLVAALTAIVLTACGGGDGAATVASPETTQPAERPNDEPGPPIEGAGLDGESLSITDHHGRPVLVNVWSSW